MTTALHISEAASLALHSMAILAQADDENITVKQISEATGFSQAHLSKVLQRLAKANLVKSSRGPKGGFTLARPPAEISFLQIYEVIEGTLVSQQCMVNANNRQCPFDRCLLSDLPDRITREFRQYLASKTLADVNV